MRKVPPAESSARCVELIRNGSTNEFTLGGKPIEASGGSESTPPPLYPNKTAELTQRKVLYVQQSVLLEESSFKNRPLLQVGM